MNRKAQFYILAAVVLLSVTFGLFAARSAVPSPARTFDMIADNYLTEAPFAANSGNLHDFTLRFYDFALAKDPGFEMVYFLVSQNNVSVFSLVKPAIFINQYNLSFNSSIVIERPEIAVVSIGESQYNLETSSSGVRAIFLSQKENEKRVRVE